MKRLLLIVLFMYLSVSLCYAQAVDKKLDRIEIFKNKYKGQDVIDMTKDQYQEYIDDLLNEVVPSVLRTGIGGMLSKSMIEDLYIPPMPLDTNKGKYSISIDGDKIMLYEVEKSTPIKLICHTYYYVKTDFQDAEDIKEIKNKHTKDMKKDKTMLEFYNKVFK